MVNWKDPQIIQNAADIFSKSLLSFLGLYIWEVVVTFDFERSFFSAPRRAWKWSYLSYFACRYSFLIALITTNLTLNTTIPFNCQAIYTVNQLFGNLSIGTASLNLALRALAIWRSNRILNIIMGGMVTCHMFIVFYCTTTLKVVKNATGTPQPCMVVGIDRAWLLTLYLYTMIFDTFIMVVCLWGLWKSKPRGGGRARELYTLLWTDGLMYFVSASVANAFPVVFMILALNPAMDVVTTIAAAVITTIASCRAVQRLNAWGTSNPATRDSEYVMSTPARRHSGRHGMNKQSAFEQGMPHGRKPRSKEHYTEGDVNLSSAMFAKTVLLEDDGRDRGNGTQYERQQKTRSTTDGGVFSLQADDRSVTSSPTAPTHWKQTPSIMSGSTQTTGNDRERDRDKTSARYKPATERVSEGSEPVLQAKARSSLYESVEEDEGDVDYAAAPPPKSPSRPPGTIVQGTPQRPRGGSRIIGIGPTESDIGFGSGSEAAGGDSESDRERQRQHAQWRG